MRARRRAHAEVAQELVRIRLDKLLYRRDLPASSLLQTASGSRVAQRPRAPMCYNGLVPRFAQMTSHTALLCRSSVCATTESELPWASQA